MTILTKTQGNLDAHTIQARLVNMDKQESFGLAYSWPCAHHRLTAWRLRAGAMGGTVPSIDRIGSVDGCIDSQDDIRGRPHARINDGHSCVIVTSAAAAVVVGRGPTAGRRPTRMASMRRRAQQYPVLDVSWCCVEGRLCTSRTLSAVHV